MPSEIIADDPVIAAAMNLMIPMIRLPEIAAKNAILEPLCDVIGVILMTAGIYLHVTFAVSLFGGRRNWYFGYPSIMA
jgi:hypothetical protein